MPDVVFDTEAHPCAGVPIDAFVIAVRWYRLYHPEVVNVEDVDWVRIRAIADEILGRKAKREKAA